MPAHQDPRLPEASPTEPPESLGDGRFHLAEEIGRGGMATVYLAQDRQLATPCAVKVFRTRLLDEERNTERFVHEARAMSRLAHPRIVGIRDAGEEQGFYWFAMDHLAGGSLEQLVERRGPVPLDEAAVTMFQVLQGLHAVHRAGLIHRDVEPANNLLDQWGEVVLADFGIARHPRGAVPYQTITDHAVGTSGYTAPEQLDDPRLVAPQPDLYGVGATLYCLLTGTRPFRLYLAPLSPQVFDDTPPVIHPVLARATHLEPLDRYPSARIMARELMTARDTWRATSGHPPEVDRWMDSFAPPGT